MRRLLFVLAALVVLPVAGCSNGHGTGPSEDQVFINGVIRRAGVVEYVNLEGGLWAIRGEDAVTYEPLGGLPASLRRSGLRVEFEGRIRDDLGSIYMVGPIVELLQIRAL